MFSVCTKTLRSSSKLSTYIRSLTTAQIFQQDGNGKSSIKNITVIGGGIMGSGVAQASAQNGFSVTVVDKDEYTQKCMVSIRKSLDIIAKKKFPDEPKSARKFIDTIFNNIKTTRKIEVGCETADLVVEAVVENLSIKQDVFRKADQASPENTIFTSNTSSLIIEDIAKSTSRPDKFAGIHFFNPVWNMKLVEIIKTQSTSDDTFKKLLRYTKDLGKVPVSSPDTLGFIVNRLLFPYLMESLRLHEHGHVSITDIDTAMKLGAGYPKGPFEIMDIIGLDTVKVLIEGWHKKEPENPLFFPSEILNKLVLDYKLGQKTGIGFYKYKHTLY